MARTRTAVSSDEFVGCSRLLPEQIPDDDALVPGGVDQLARCRRQVKTMLHNDPAGLAAGRARSGKYVLTDGTSRPIHACAVRHAVRRLVR